MESTYRETLLYLLKATNIELKKGEAIIFVFRDKNHYECKSEYKSDVKILRVPSEFLDTLVTQNDKKNIAMCCLGFGEKADYSDLRVVYFMELKA